MSCEDVRYFCRNSVPSTEFLWYKILILAEVKICQKGEQNEKTTNQAQSRCWTMKRCWNDYWDPLLMRILSHQRERRMVLLLQCWSVLMEIFADLGQALLKRSISTPEVVVVIYIALSVVFLNARSATLTRLPSRLWVGSRTRWAWIHTSTYSRNRLVSKYNSTFRVFVLFWRSKFEPKNRRHSKTGNFVCSLCWQKSRKRRFDSPSYQCPDRARQVLSHINSKARRRIRWCSCFQAWYVTQMPWLVNFIRQKKLSTNRAQN